MTHIAHPLRPDRSGRTAAAPDDAYIRQLVELVLFTAPGERVMRPDFGSGIRQLLFAPNSQELLAATQFLVQGSLQRWLGDLIQLEGVEVTSDGSTLTVHVRFTVLRTRERRLSTFTLGA